MGIFENSEVFVIVWGKDLLNGEEVDVLSDHFDVFLDLPEFGSDIEIFFLCFLIGEVEVAILVV